MSIPYFLFFSVVVGVVVYLVFLSIKDAIQPSELTLYNLNVLRKNYPIGSKWEYINDELDLRCYGSNWNSYDKIFTVVDHFIGKRDCEGPWYEDVMFNIEQKDGRKRECVGRSATKCNVFLKRIEE